MHPSREELSGYVLGTLVESAAHLTEMGTVEIVVADPFTETYLEATRETEEVQETLDELDDLDVWAQCASASLVDRSLMTGLGAIDVRQVPYLLAVRF